MTVAQVVFFTLAILGVAAITHFIVALNKGSKSAVAFSLFCIVAWFGLLYQGTQAYQYQLWPSHYQNAVEDFKESKLIDSTKTLAFLDDEIYHRIYELSSCDLRAEAMDWLSKKGYDVADGLRYLERTALLDSAIRYCRAERIRLHHRATHHEKTMYKFLIDNFGTIVQKRYFAH